MGMPGTNRCAGAHLLVPMGMPGMNMNMMRPQMGNMPRPQQQMGGPGGPISAASLASAPPGVQKQMLGEKLYPKIAAMQPEMAGKITGMMLENDYEQLRSVIDDHDQLVR